MKKACLIWITGLPGAGKTTLAKKVHTLISKKTPAVFMDGDVFREIMGDDLGYSKAHRFENALRLVRMNKYLIEHGISVVCATVSLFKKIHEWNRTHISRMLEVFLDVPHEILHKRDQKKLYSDGKKGKVKHVIGIHQTYDKPQNPDIVILNSGSSRQLIAHAKPVVQKALKMLE